MSLKNKNSLSFWDRLEFFRFGKKLFVRKYTSAHTYTTYK